MILAIDTVSPVAMAVGLGGREGSPREICTEPDARSSGKQLIELVEAVVGERRGSVTAVAVTSGPGSYAGLRIGIATARSLGLGLGIPVIGVPTFEVVREAARGQAVTAVHPAGRGEWAVEQDRGDEPVIASSEELAGTGRLVGEGAGGLGGLEVSASERVDALLRIAARELASGRAAGAITPHYLREPNITRPRRTPLLAGGEPIEEKNTNG